MSALVMMMKNLVYREVLSPQKSQSCLFVHAATCRANETV